MRKPGEDPSRPMRRRLLAALLLLTAAPVWAGDCLTRGTGDLGVVIERAAGSLRVVDVGARRELFRVEDLGDLSHASVVFSPDQRYAFVFGRDGALSKVDLLCGRVIERIKQAGNSIGGAISQDGDLVAVSNYEPGGVRIFRASDLEPVTRIPATYDDDKRAKVVGLVDAPGERFVFSLYEAGAIWVADLSNPGSPEVERFEDVGRKPYDGLVDGRGRYYIAGLFGEDGLALLDLWQTGQGVRRILDDYGRGDQRLPVYKMPHLEGWALTDEHAFIPAVGRHALLVVDRDTWQEVKRIELPGQPVFAVARPDGRQVWVNFAHPDNDTLRVIDVASLEVVEALDPGPGVLHMEFTPKGEAVWVSVRDDDAVHVYDTASFERVAELEAKTPSGIFFTHRAHEIGR